jgi:hypothetical protein
VDQIVDGAGKIDVTNYNRWCAGDPIEELEFDCSDIPAITDEDRNVDIYTDEFSEEFYRACGLSEEEISSLMDAGKQLLARLEKIDELGYLNIDE